MGLYNVVAPCVVGQLHYTRRSTTPIEVDDDVALPLVDEGKLEPVTVFVAPALGVDFVEPFAVLTTEPGNDEDSAGAEKEAADDEKGTTGGAEKPPRRRPRPSGRRGPDSDPDGE